MVNRREFLQRAALIGAGMLIPVGANSWIGQSLAQSQNSKRLIVVMLRGAVDGLSVVVPHQEENYYVARPTIAIAKPKTEGGVIDLDGFFGLNPVLAPLMPLWKRRELAFVQATGLPELNRSHFEAQFFLENGTPGIKDTRTGWMNRLLEVIAQTNPTQAINFGTKVPQILTGNLPVASVTRGKNSARPLALDRPPVTNAFDRLYSGNDALSQAYQQGKQARTVILEDLETEMIASANGAPRSVGFALEAKKIARLMIGNAKAQLAFIDFGDWDTHVNQKGRLNNNLKKLGDGLATLVKELKPIYNDTVILVLSEFGRTVAENGNRGTDHGYGNVMWLIGGAVKGGITGEWPGLDSAQLYQGRDLAVTTDFRAAIATVLTQHLEINSSHLASVFPEYTLTKKLDLFG